MQSLRQHILDTAGIQIEGWSVPLRCPFFLAQHIWKSSLEENRTYSCLLSLSDLWTILLFSYFLLVLCEISSLVRGFWKWDLKTCNHNYSVKKSLSFFLLLFFFNKWETWSWLLCGMELRKNTVFVARQNTALVIVVTISNNMKRTPCFVLVL